MLGCLNAMWEKHKWCIWGYWSPTGAGSVGTRTGAGSVGTRTGAGSGADSVGSRTGAGS